MKSPIKNINKANDDNGTIHHVWMILQIKSGNVLKIFMQGDYKCPRWFPGKQKICFKPVTFSRLVATYCLISVPTMKVFG